jgi:hypothetical protein
VSIVACWLQLSGGQLVVLQPKLVKQQHQAATNVCIACCR